VAKCKSVGVAVADQNFIHEESMNRLNSGNAYYHLLQKHLSSHLLSKFVKTKIYKTIIVHVVLYGHETRSLKGKNIDWRYLRTCCRGGCLDRRHGRSLEKTVMRGFVTCTLCHVQYN
jgi:hypothetical protein